MCRINLWRPRCSWAWVSLTKISGLTNIKQLLHHQYIDQNEWVDIFYTQLIKHLPLSIYLNQLSHTLHYIFGLIFIDDHNLFLITEKL